MKKQADPDAPIELMSARDVCAYTLMSLSSLNKRSRDPDDDFPMCEWLGKTRVWRATVIRQYVFAALTTERPDHHLRAQAPADNLDSLKFGDADHPRSERMGGRK